LAGRLTGLQAAYLRLALSKIGHWRLGEAVALSSALTSGTSSDERNCTLEHPTSTTYIAEGIPTVVGSQRCGVRGDDDESEPAPIPTVRTPAEEPPTQGHETRTGTMTGPALDGDVLALLGVHIAGLSQAAEEQVQIIRINVPIHDIVGYGCHHVAYYRPMAISVQPNHRLPLHYLLSSCGS
jgi:hypothetical protein